jgi:hypothetical protein
MLASTHARHSLTYKSLLSLLYHAFHCHLVSKPLPHYCLRCRERIPPLRLNNCQAKLKNRLLQKYRPLATACTLTSRYDQPTHEPGCITPASNRLYIFLSTPSVDNNDHVAGKHMCTCAPSVPCQYPVTILCGSQKGQQGGASRLSAT